MTLGSNIKHCMNRTGASYSQIADFCDTSEQTIQQLVARDSNKSKFLFSIARFFGLPADVMHGGTEAEIDSTLLAKNPQLRVPASPHISAEESQNVTRTRIGNGIPVTRLVTCGLGEFEDMQAESIGKGQERINWPSDDPQAHAVRVFGNDLAPRCKHGEYIIIEPSLPFSNGDEVYVELTTTDQPLIVVFLYEKDGLHHFEDVNGTGKRTSVNNKHISSISFISGFSKPSMLKK
jgi:phage repressor protein C with HTH and peptisase S24 domain